MLEEWMHQPTLSQQDFGQVTHALQLDLMS